MEEQGYIEVKIDGLVGNKPLKPIDIDIAEIKEIISDVETFLYPVLISVFVLWSIFASQF